jgi:DNA mismatch repair protein MutL
VLWAVREAFSRFITSSLKPSWFCFLTVDPSKIDVNIHPTKQKIKFEDEKALFSFIFGTIHSAMKSHLSITQEETPQNESGKSAAGPFREQGFHGYDSARPQAQAGEQSPGIHEENPGPTDFVSAIKTTGDSQQLSLSFLSILDEKEVKEKLVETRNAVAGELAEGTSWNLIQCFQINKMFILAPIKNGILIIDQHAAHERILYEEALEDIRRGKGESQRLLFPVVFEMTTAQKEVVISCRDYFSMLGFDVQDFGGHTLAISAMPATGFMKSTAIEEAIREIVTNLIEEKDRAFLSDPQRRFAASFACGAAIKFGQELKQEEMNILLNSLFATKDPYICPHGRPTLIRISIDELLRRFLR